VNETREHRITWGWLRLFLDCAQVSLAAGSVGALIFWIFSGMNFWIFWKIELGTFSGNSPGFPAFSGLFQPTLDFFSNLFFFSLGLGKLKFITQDFNIA
jgi:hypothetical protein